MACRFTLTQRVVSHRVSNFHKKLSGLLVWLHGVAAVSWPCVSLPSYLCVFGSFFIFRFDRLVPIQDCQCLTPSFLVLCSLCSFLLSLCALCFAQVSCLVFLAVTGPDALLSPVFLFPLPLPQQVFQCDTSGRLVRVSLRWSPKPYYLALSLL